MKTNKFYQYQRIVDENGEVVNGDYILGEGDEQFIIRCKNGFLNDVETDDGEILPAFELVNGTHIEHWKNGLLHSEKTPAVIDIIDDTEEWWYEGRFIEPLE